MSVLNHLKDYRVVKVSLPLKEGEPQILDGVAKITTSPQFEITFLPDQLSTDKLNLEEFCKVSFDVAGESKSIKAKFNEIAGEAKILLEMVDSFSYVQKRDYFRVDAELAVSYWVIDEDKPKAQSVQASVNISGGGIRFPVTEQLQNGARLGMEIIIDEPQPAVVECVGEVVGFYKEGGGKHLAVRFVKIEDDDQDAIVAYCLAEQRKQLRLKVKVLGN